MHWPTGLQFQRPRSSVFLVLPRRTELGRLALGLLDEATRCGGKHEGVTGDAE